MSKMHINVKSFDRYCKAAVLQQIRNSISWVVSSITSDSTLLALHCTFILLWQIFFFQVYLFIIHITFYTYNKNNNKTQNNRKCVPMKHGTWYTMEVVYDDTLPW